MAIDTPHPREAAQLTDHRGPPASRFPAEDDQDGATYASADEDDNNNDNHRMMEVAQAQAQVAAMEGPTNQRSRAGRRMEDEAVMGAAAAEDGVPGFDVTDESGELVMQRFLQFLGE